MDVYECIRTRRTVREFKPDPVPDELLERLVEAAFSKPAGGRRVPVTRSHGFLWS